MMSCTYTGDVYMTAMRWGVPYELSYPRINLASNELQKMYRTLESEFLYFNVASVESPRASNLEFRTKYPHLRTSVESSTASNLEHYPVSVHSHRTLERNTHQLHSKRWTM